jgi:hypothetical protein
MEAAGSTDARNNFVVKKYHVPGGLNSVPIGKNM